MERKHILYAIPGLGVDHRLFAALQLQHAEIRVLRWISPRHKEPLGDYAMRMAEQIDRSADFSLLGVSFGGMCCVEIARQLAPRHLVLVSTSKKRSELPLLIRMAKYLPLHRLFGDAFFVRMACLMYRRFGVLPGEQKKLFRAMLLDAPPAYFRDTISAIAGWMNTDAPRTFLHLHGDNDRILPLSCIDKKNGEKQLRVIEKGTHFMILNSAPEIAGFIDELLIG